MIIFIIVLLIPVLLYVILISAYISGLKKNFNCHFSSTKVKKEKKNKPKASIVVACRNEEKNIDRLLRRLVNQNFDESYEIIIVNDHSEDKTEQVILAFAERHKNVKYLKLARKTGKKAAVKLAIDRAKSDFILTSDADCEVSGNWLKSHYKSFMKTDALLISGFVVLEGKGLPAKFQELEFLSLIASGAGSIGINKGIMCNAANMSFSKKVFEDENVLHENKASGDDMFLLQAVKKFPENKVLFVPDKEMLVKSKTKTSLKSFINQRLRWASKSGEYSDFDMILSSYTVFFTAFSIILQFFLSLALKEFLYLFLISFFAKAIVDFIILYLITSYLERKKLLWYFLPLSAVYPFYIVFIAVASQILGFNWKGRSYKK